MKIIFLVTAVAIGVVAAKVQPARANDSAAELSIGGLQFARTSAVAMESEELRISLDRVTVRYQFRNVSTAPVDLTVAFPLPDIDLSEGESIAFPSSDPVNFVDFETKVDGSPVKFTIDQRATVGDKDVTPSLREYKVPVLPIGDRQIRAQDLPEAIRSKMVDEGLLLPAGSNERGRPLYEPGWIVKTSAVRRQTFPAGRAITVEHSYRPSVGGSSDTILRKGLRQARAMGAEVERYRREYCVTDGFLAELDKLTGAGQENKAGVQERRISYVLKTGANWAGPIKEFRLAADGGKGRLVSFCHSGLNQAPGSVSEFEAKDFVPTQNLKILVVGKF